jgi:hypothetical protein
VVTPRERVISCLQWPAQHFGDGDGRGREAQVPAPRPSKSGSKREKERILFPGHRPGSRALRGNVEGLLTGAREIRTAGLANKLTPVLNLTTQLEMHTRT